MRGRENTCRKKKVPVSHIVFYCAVLAYPVLQFSIMWLGVNVNSILLAFKRYDINTMDYTWIGFDNFSRVLSDLAHSDKLLYSLRNSIILYAFTWVSLPVTLLITFYIHKKFCLSGFFKVILYVPTFISSVIMVFIYKMMIERGYPEIVFRLTGDRPLGLLTNPDTSFAMVILYTVYFSFGGGMLMYLGAMGGVCDELVEAAQLDGAGLMREFWHGMLPGIWPTLSVYILTGAIGFLLADPGLFLFYDLNADAKYYTFGYYLFRGIKQAGQADFPYYSAYGIVFTFIAIPLMVIVRLILNRVDPMRGTEA